MIIDAEGRLIPDIGHRPKKKRIEFGRSDFKKRLADSEALFTPEIIDRLANRVLEILKKK